MIYADHASTTKLCHAALRAMTEAMTENYGNPASLHAIGRSASLALAEARETIASCLSCEAEEVIFTSGGSEADNHALRAAAHLGKMQGKCHILSTVIEHPAVLRTLEALKKEGFSVELMPVDADGILSPKTVKAHIRPDTCLVSVMYANNELGTIEPIREIGEICRSHGVLFHSDCVQAAGQLPIHVQSQNIDMLSLSAHKFYGPKGIGVLYCKKNIPLEGLILGGEQERGRRAGTENLPAILGMAAALSEMTEQLETNTLHVTALRDRLIEGLAKIPRSAPNGSLDHRLCGNVNFCFEDVHGESLLMLLDEAGICASAGSACSARSKEPSHVLLAVGRSPDLARSSLRLSLGRDNTPEEVDIIIEKVTEAVARLRQLSPVWQEKTEGKRAFLL